MSTKRANVTTEQASKILSAYELLGVPSDRLPHTPQIAAMATDAGLTEEQVWNFFLDCRGQSSKKPKIPTIEGKKAKRRAPLDPDHCEAFEQTLGERMIANAENEVYMPLFIGWADARPERTRNEWAYDLIRYRKWKATHDAGVMPKKSKGPKARLARMTEQLRKTTNLQTTTEEYVVGWFEKDRLGYIGVGPLPNGFELIRGINAAECLELHRTFHSVKVTKNVFRVTRDELVHEEAVL